jgi:diguanylate cyclase (GGDEF)-like protein/PAS domain S-box-containing protein
MNIAERKVLVVSDDAAVAWAIRRALEQPEDGFAVVCVRNLSAGIARVLEEGIDAILLDLFLPDSQGIDSFDELFLAARRIPIVVVTERDQEEVARQAMHHGARDRMLKNHIEQYSFALILRHILARAALDDALFVERERAQVTLNSIGDAVISTDKAGYVTYVNPAAEKMTGWSREEASGRMLTDVFHLIDGDTRQRAPNPMEFAVQRNKIVGLPNHAVLIRRDGVESAIEDSIAPIHDQAGQITGAVMVFRDVSQARAIELQLSHLAQHDTLTDLPNRMLLTDRLKHSIALARRYGRQVAVLFIDVDRFKQINDSLGHAVGDEVLQGLARRLNASVRGSDTVSRHGGDEFVVVLSEVEHSQSAVRHAQRIAAVLAEPQVIAEHHLRVSVSVGISIFPDDGEDAETLIKCADTAMYHAKENGRNTHQFYMSAMERPEGVLQSSSC